MKSSSSLWNKKAAALIHRRVEFVILPNPQLRRANRDYKLPPRPAFLIDLYDTCWLDVRSNNLALRILKVLVCLYWKILGTIQNACRYNIGSRTQWLIQCDPIYKPCANHEFFTTSFHMHRTHLFSGHFGIIFGAFVCECRQLVSNVSCVRGFDFTGQYAVGHILFSCSMDIIYSG